jgi:RNA polymerase sigma factor (sigma-70 family)
MLTAAKAAAGAIGVAALAFGLWKVRSIIVLLLLALTFAAAMRPGVEWLHRRKVPEAAAILSFFVLTLGTFVLFFWLAVPPAVHELRQALAQPLASGKTIHNSTGFRHDVLVWVNTHVHHLPSGTAIFHPITAYGHKATDAVVGVFFTLAATWYWVSERDSMIDLLVRLAPEAKRESARQTYLEIDRRLRAYTRLKFLMVAVIGAILAAGFYLVGLDYWLLVGGAVSLFEIIPVVGPLLGVLLVLAVGLPESVHVAVLGVVVLVAVREFQSYVINPHVMGRSVGLSPLVTLVTVSVVGILFGALAVILAIPAASAAETLIDVLVFGHEPPSAPPPQAPAPCADGAEFPGFPEGLPLSVDGGIRRVHPAVDPCVAMGLSAAESNGRSQDTEALYREHGRAVDAFCRSLLRDRGEAEDATQQVFLSAHRALLNGSAPREPLAWLLAVARHECHARFRQRAASPLPVDDLPDTTSPDASVEVLRAGELATVWNEVGRMPTAQREAFLLREIRGLSYRQLADELALSPPSVRSLLLRARTRLRHRLGDVAAGLSGMPWAQALIRLVAGGDGASPVATATKAAAVGIGALALVGGGGDLAWIARHPAGTPRHAAAGRQGGHARVTRSAAPAAASVAGSGLDDRHFEHSRGDDEGSRVSSAESSSGSGEDRGGDATVAAQPTTDGRDGATSSSSGSGSDGSGSSSGGSAPSLSGSGSDSGSNMTTTITTSSGSSSLDGGGSDGGTSDGSDGGHGG